MLPSLSASILRFRYGWTPGSFSSRYTSKLSAVRSATGWSLSPPLLSSTLAPVAAAPGPPVSKRNAPVPEPAGRPGHESRSHRVRREPHRPAMQRPGPHHNRCARRRLGDGEGGGGALDDAVDRGGQVDQNGLAVVGDRVAQDRDRHGQGGLPGRGIEGQGAGGGCVVLPGGGGAVGGRVVHGDRLAVAPGQRRVDRAEPVAAADADQHLRERACPWPARRRWRPRR